MEFSKTYQYRKVMKPMLERKRRARINKCLDDLKDIMVECLMKDGGEQLIRLEKADILELTVDYLKRVKHQKKHDVTSTESFRVGYVHAVNEVSKALASTKGVNIQLGTTLMTHLGYRLHELQSSNENSTKVINNTNVNYSGYTQPMSPASSGYESDRNSPCILNESSSTSIPLINIPDISTKLWRPW